MKYLIFGRGMIGTRLFEFLEDAYLSSVDIGNQEEVRNEILDKNPEVIINCAGKTGKPNVDWCEDHKVETLYSNVIGPLILVKVCQELKKYFVHVGTGCVYEGDNNGRGFSEEDKPNFFGSFYSKSKIWSQEALSEFENVLILRLRMPILSEVSDRSYIRKIVKYPKIISEKNSMTIVDDLLEVTKYLIENKRTGTYNVTNPGSISPKEILDMYKEIVDSTHTYEDISLDELHSFTKAKRSNCVLNTDKLEKEFKLKTIRERVREILEKYKTN